MSRVGKQPISIPSGVTVTVANKRVSVKGGKGELFFPVHDGIAVKVDSNKINVALEQPAAVTREVKALFGLTRAELANMVEGVNKGYEKKLEVIGVGWNAQVQGKDLVLQVGYCAPLRFPIPQGLEVKCPSQTLISISGADKQKIGQFAARVRKSRPPEPYNGKGVKYENEVIKRKAGKTFTASGA